MIEINKIKSPFLYCCQKVIPLAFDESLSYYEVLCHLTAKIKEVIEEQNIEGQAIQELQEKYLLLVDYVDNYFDNLDVQEEINNKLDDMAESGELTDIIAQYLQLAGVLAYNTLNDLENAENVANGSICMILGKDTYNDGKTCYYKIREILNTDVIDGDNIIAITNDETLVGEKISKYDIEQLDTRVGSLEEDITDMVTNVAGMPELIQLYVDSTDGDDTKDGTTIDNRMKTLDAIFNKYINKGNLVIRITFYPGTYSFNQYVINCCGLHFGIKGSTTGNVTINFANPYHSGNDFTDIGLYNSHIKITGNATQKFILNGGDACKKLYLDGGSMALEYVETTNTILAFYGAYLRGDNVIIRQLFGQGSNILIDNTSKLGLCEFYTCVTSLRQVTFMCDTQVSSSQTYQITNVNTQLMIYGSTYCDLTNSPLKANFMILQGGSLTLRAGINKTGSNTYTGKSQFEGATLKANQGRYNNFKALTTTITFDEDCITSSITL